MEMTNVAFVLIVYTVSITKGFAVTQDSVEAIQQKTIAELVTKLSSIDKHVDSMQEQLSSQQQVIQNQNAVIDDLRKELRDTKQKTEWLSKTLQQKNSYMKTVYSDFGCFQDELSLSCPSGQLINVTYATYGMNTQTCTDDCCAPYPSDCTELVSENDYATWLALKYTCDDTSACVFIVEGALINECEVDYSADYMQIFYDCLPEAADVPLGFTAKASIERNYAENAVIIFDDVLTNFGNGYDPETNFFTCQRHGMYIFGSTIYTNGDTICAELILDNTLTIEGYVLDHDNSYPSVTFQAIIECKKGQIVWMRANFAMFVYSNYYRMTHFYGALLHVV